MNLSRIIFSFLLLSIVSLCAQTTVAEIDLKESFGFNKPNRIFSAVDESTGDNTIFLLRKGSWHALLFDKKGEFQSKLSFKSKIGASQKLLDSFYDGTSFNILFKATTGILRVKFNFKINSCTKEHILLPKEKKIQIGSFYHEQTYYYLLLNKNSSRLQFILLNDQKGYTTKDVLLGDKNFKILDDSFVGKFKEPTNLYSILDYHGIKRLENIYHNTEVSYGQASNHAKLFINPSNIHICLDLSRRTTSVISISLDDFSSKLQHISYNDTLHFKYNHNSFNSFLKDNKLYQIRAQKKNKTFLPSYGLVNNKDSMILRIQVVDILSEGIIQSFVATNEDDSIHWIKGALKREPTNSLTTEIPVKDDDKGYVIISQLSFKNSVILPKTSANDLRLYIGASRGTFEAMNFINYNKNPLLINYYNTMYSRSSVSEVLLQKNKSPKSADKNIFQEVINYMDNKKHRDNLTLFDVNNKLHVCYFDYQDKRLKIVKF